MPRVTDQLKMTPFYGVFQYIIRGFCEAFFRGEVIGTENIPLSGPFLIAANHASHLDPPVVGSYVPRQIRFFARRTLWSHPLGQWWMTSTECIPVERESGDVGAIRKVLQALQEDRAVVLFPEGTRSPDGRFQKPKAGVGLLACKTRVPVVPCRIFRSHEALGKGRVIPRLGTPITIVFGRPLSAAEYDDPSAGSERYQIASERIFARITAMPEPEYPVI